MRFLPRLNRKKRVHEKSASRSVIFIERNDKVGKSTKLFAKRGFFKRRLKFFSDKQKKILSIIFFISSVIIIVIFLFTVLDTDSAYISPLPIANNSARHTNEVDRKLVEELKKQNIEYLSIDTSEGSVFYIILREKQEVVIAGNKDIPSQIASLQFIYNRLTMEGKEFKRLDLRFDKPVITLK